MNGYSPAMQVKQYVAEVFTSRGVGFRVFRTGAPSTYLFCQMDAQGCDTGLHWPVRSRDLTTRLRRALANGCGLDLRN